MEKELESKHEFLKEDKDEVVEIIDGKKVRYNFSFEARLSQTTDENKEYYKQILDMIQSFGLKSSKSWKQERFYSGRKTYGAILFKGKRICVAMALDPKKYEETKYKGIDLSDVKRFEDIPMLIKLTSDRKLKYVKELLQLLFEEQGFTFKEMGTSELVIPYETTEELLKKELVKLVISKTRKTKIVQTEVVAIEETPKEAVKTEVVVIDKPGLNHVKSHPMKKHKNQKRIINLRQVIGLSNPITLEALKEAGFVSKRVAYVKLLGDGFVNKAIIIKLNACSKKAHLKLIQAKGSFVKI